MPDHTDDELLGKAPGSPRDDNERPLQLDDDTLEDRASNPRLVPPDDPIFTGLSSVKGPYRWPSDELLEEMGIKAGPRRVPYDEREIPPGLAEALAKIREGRES